MKQAKIITVYSQKGGICKTTTAVNLAFELATKFGKTLLCDLDPQGSAMMWTNNAPENKPFPADTRHLSVLGAGIIKELKKEFNKYDYIIIDTKPSLNSTSARAALLVSDAVLIPVVPAPLEIFSTDDTHELVMEAKAQNDKLKVIYVLSKVRHNTKLSKQMTEDVVNTIKSYDNSTLLNTKITNYVAYEEAPLYGVGISETPSTPAGALAQYADFIEEFMTELQE